MVSNSLLLLSTLTLLCCYVNARSVLHAENQIEDEIDNLNQVVDEIAEEISDEFSDEIYDEISNKISNEFSDETDSDLDIIYDPVERNNKRSALFKTTLWTPNSEGIFQIPYVIRQDDPVTGYEFTPKEYLTIELAISYFNLALRCKNKPWVPRTDEREYIEFRKYKTCRSYVGKKTHEPVLNGVQPIVLNSKCVQKAGSIIHEMMHVLGFLHEHMRPDRDEYVKVNFQNIFRGELAEFEKIPDDYILQKSTEYDYMSILHYKKNAVARTPNLITLETKNKTFEDKIGQRDMLSNLDMVAINDYFKCPDVATTIPSKTNSTLQDDILQQCNFEDGICDSMYVNKDAWKIISDSTCVDRLATCKQLDGYSLCTKEPVSQLMQHLCGPSCKVCNPGQFLTLTENPKKNVFGLMYGLVSYSSLAKKTKCSFDELTDVCLHFDVMRTMPALGDSKLEAYALNYKKTYNANTKRHGRRYTYRTKKQEVSTSVGEGGWGHQKISLEIKCDNAIVVMGGLKMTDGIKIDNFMVKAGNCFDSEFPVNSNGMIQA